jgi:hypothetical protein
MDGAAKHGVYLQIGGLFAAGFDATGEFLLVVSHNGRGVFSTRTWERVARDTSPAYPGEECGIGIGPLSGQTIPLTEMDFAIERFSVQSPNGKIQLDCESDGIAVIART